jgi:hypothetical protein
MSLRGTAPKRLCREPLWTLGDQRKCPLDSSVFGGLALERSDRQRFARGRPLERDEVRCRFV